MAQARKGVLVVDEDELVGIFTPKDMLSRVIAKGLSPDLTSVASVMTPNPDCVSPRSCWTHCGDARPQVPALAVREEDGTVLVHGCDGAGAHSAGGDRKGWRDFFSSAMDAKNMMKSVDDALSEFVYSVTAFKPRLSTYRSAQSQLHGRCIFGCFRLREWRSPRSHERQCFARPIIRLEI